jgi:HAD superfamily hydrolase (TIGR01509 family)
VPTRLVIFDCDGVLIDSEPIACSVLASTLSSLGFPISAEQGVLRFTGISAGNIRQIIELEFARALPREFEALYAAVLRAEFKRALKVMDGIFDQINYLKTQKIGACVASSSSLERLEFTLKKVGLWDHFAPNIFSANQVEAGKPAPHLFRYAADRMDTEPQHCLVVEDSIPGVCAARAAGMRVVGFVGGTHCQSDHAALLASAGADATFSKINALSQFID